jgi:polyhydroxyalkanoate synthase
MRGLAGAAGRELATTRRRARNGFRAAAGLDRVEIARTPRHVVWRSGPVTLYRYVGPEPTREVPVLLVMSLVTKPAIFDLLPGMSLVEVLQSQGYAVFLLDWGVPGPAEARNGVNDYIDRFLPRAVNEAVRDSGAAQVSLLCYCLGGTLSLLSVAAHPELPIAGILSVATVVDFTQLGPIPNLVRHGSLEIRHVVDETGNVPPEILARAIKLVKPTGDLTTLLSLWDALAHEGHLYAHRALLGWASDHIPFPGRTAEELVDLGMRRNELVTGKVSLDTGTVDLARVQCRVLNIYGTEDALVPPSAHSMLADVLPAAEVRQLELPTGHVGLFFGRQARKATSAMMQWLAEHSPTVPASHPESPR